MGTKRLLILGLAVLEALWNANALAADIWHVNGDTGNDANTSSTAGTSWAEPFATVTKALAMADASANGSLEIWVAKSTNPYTPGTSASATYTVQTSGIQLLGGFAGNETQSSQRSPGTNETILSGGGVNQAVLTCIDVDARTRISGFTIKFAAQHGIVVQAQTGNCEPQLDTLKIQENANVNTPDITEMGGGLMITGGFNAFPTLTGCKFIENFAVAGGAIFIDGPIPMTSDPGSRLLATNCEFDDNSAFTPSPLPSGARMRGQVDY